MAPLIAIPSTWIPIDGSSSELPGHRVFINAITDMLLHMRTTVEIADSLMEEVREEMKRRGVTFRALVEDGLRQLLRESRREAIEVPDARFEGELGFAEDVHRDELPQRIREAIEEGRDGSFEHRPGSERP
jgi:hypothetical protein